MKHLVVAILGVCAFNAFSKEPNIQKSFTVYMFEKTRDYNQGIDMIGSHSAMVNSVDLEERMLSPFANFERYPELRAIQEETATLCRKKQREIQNSLYQNYMEDKLTVGYHVENVSRMLKSINENHHNIVELKAEIGNACHIIISAKEDYEIAETKTVMGNKAQDCENKLEDNKTGNTVLQEVRTGWSLFNFNYCRIDQYEVVKK